ncbi:MAG: ABC transporter ATP-binding protein [Proteobacteria bacterium]|nr:ABC transporter ATP-binding protein [Pseudomonadota bacterium]
MLRLIDIHKTYKIGPEEVEVLRGISITIDKGELFAIIGPSGSGKSTLMNTMGLLDKPTSGSYFIEDTRITYDDDRVISTLRNKKIGFVFQSYNLLPRKTAVENVGIPLIYRGLKKSEIKEQSMEYLKKVEMDKWANHKPNELSGGQQQRVAIARALVGKPAIILADEPTGALDTHTGQEILAFFKKMNEEEGITFVIITHDLGIAKQCERMTELRDGIIIDSQGMANRK